MRKTGNEYWARIEQVLLTSGLSVRALANYIGLLSGENLYQIKWGHNRISPDLAKRIHDKYPQFSVPWLLCGEQVTTPIPDSFVRLPLYTKLGAMGIAHQAAANPDFVIPKAAARIAELALIYSGNSFLSACQSATCEHKSVLLLREYPNKEPIYTGVYFIVTTDMQQLNVVQNCGNPNYLRLSDSAFFTKYAHRSIIDRREICSMWAVCGICNWSEDVK